MRTRPRRTIATVVLTAVTPLMIGAAVTGFGARAEATAAGSRAVASTSINPVQCVRDWEACMAAEAQGNPCDPLPC